MTPQQITQIRDSFALVQPMADEVAALFYRHLFTADPSLRPLFKGDMQQQGALLMTIKRRAGWSSSTPVSSVMSAWKIFFCPCVMDS